MPNDALDFLMGGAPTANFLKVGTVREGKILKYELVQQRDMDTGALLTWDDGNPMMQMVFTLDTGVLDPDIENDDGVRRLFAKAQMLKAIRDAIKGTGHKGEIRGGTLAVKYDHDDPPKRAGFNGPKVYRARFTPPDPTEVFDEMAAEVPTPDDTPDFDDEPPF